MSPKNLAVFFAFFAGFISGQEIIVVDALTSEPLANVSLYNQTKNRNTNTNKEGKCSVLIKLL